MNRIGSLIIIATVMFVILGCISLLARKYSLNSIKGKTVGDGQHGTARFASKREVHKKYKRVLFTPDLWRHPEPEKDNKHKRKEEVDDKALSQGIIVGCEQKICGVEFHKDTKQLKDKLVFKYKTYALVDNDDVHALMIGASGVGKTAYFLYPNTIDEDYLCYERENLLHTHAGSSHDFYLVATQRGAFEIKGELICEELSKQIIKTFTVIVE